MNAFVTVTDGSYEYEVSRSRFLGICRRVATDEEAAERLQEIRRQYRDCTHVCYAYVTRESSRSSDDGEPSGTAGAPIMECIRTAGVCDTLVAVVRWFGGIKLGTGGLVRAYTHTASETLGAVGKTEVAQCEVVDAHFAYAVWKKIEKRSLQSLYKLLATVYNKTVDVTYAAQSGDALCE
ncbi:MAG: YigZ family protein, partial [Clostridiales bacterium]|nr:YigZ family protein [Clostridiales bacterium]